MRTAFTLSLVMLVSYWGYTDEPTASSDPSQTELTSQRGVMLKMQDGSMIAGELQIDAFTIETEFGSLKVPIDRLVSITPGLDSNETLRSQLEQSIRDLGSEEYKTREQAHKKLVEFGASIVKILEPFLQSENAEVKRHVAEIVQEIQEQIDSSDEEVSSPSSFLIRKDTLATGEFTVVGRVRPSTFDLKTKYGPLTVALGDVVFLDSSSSKRGMQTRKSLTVPGQNLVQRTYKSSGIRVEAGDTISVTADGSIIMSPWGAQSSGPEGMPNLGWYIPSQIANGALVARIGDKAQPFKVGSNATFVAKNGGILQFAVAVMNEYSNEGYAYPGEYRIKIKVTPK